MFGGYSFDPAKDIPDLSGKVIFVTGGNAGIGKSAIAQLGVHKPAHIYLAARTASKAEDAIQELKATIPDTPITHISLDLTSFDSIRAAAESFKKQSTRLDILINNAGIMATPFDLTKEGYEIQFGTNHVGHALLMKLLLPTLLQTAAEPGADVRIVNLSSEGHRMAPRGGIIYDQAQLEQYYTWQRYGQSKLANILFTKELARRYPQIRSVVVHPGIIMTDLYSSFMGRNVLTKVGNFMFNIVARPVMLDIKTGAYNTVWAATNEKAQSGEYYVPVAKLGRPTAYAKDPELAKQLWEWTEEEFKKHGF